MNFLDFSRCASVRKGLEDLHVDVGALACLDLDPVVKAGNDLLLGSNRGEVGHSLAELMNNLVLEGANEGELFLVEA